VVLAPNEYAYIRDTTKGTVKTAVGPMTVTLTQQEEPIEFDRQTKEFKRVSAGHRIRFTTAPEGWYVELFNPAEEDKAGISHPASPSTAASPDLDVGRKVVVPGPVSFPLWPGQMANVVRGHKLRTNQYLICEVYEAESARENWESAVIETADTGIGEGDTGDDGKKDKKTPKVAKKVEKSFVESLVNGKRIVTKGTDVAFYIPPTGVKVLKTDGKYVREAVTLESPMEYAVLVSEKGKKEFPRGPAVVFPAPDQVFKTKDGSRKFKAIELNEISGIYVKVTAPYTEKSGKGKEKKFEEGDELFLTGKDVKFYIPREEHALIEYRKGQKVVVNRNYGREYK